MKIINKDSFTVSDTAQSNFDMSIGEEELIDRVLDSKEYCVVSQLDSYPPFKITYSDVFTRKLKRVYASKNDGDVTKVISPIFKGEIHILHRSELEEVLGERYKAFEDNNVLDEGFY